MLEATNNLEKKKLENKQRSLDRELEIANNKITKEKQLLEKNTVRGSTDEDSNKAEKLAEQELQIRKNPAARVSDILKKVFKN